MLPYDEAFAHVGLRLVKTQANEPFDAGLSIEFGEHAAVIENVRHNSPAEDAGLQANDEIVSLGGRKISEKSWLKTLARFKTGESVPIVVQRDRRKINASLVLGQPERFEYSIEEKPDATVEQKALRTSWLSGN